MLSICPKDKIGARYRSAATSVIDSRPVSKGIQSYTTDKTVYPITQPVEKLEALVSGYKKNKRQQNNKNTVIIF